jgi:5-deoxy-5-amino-3-dehydroquinate synthase
VKVKVDLVRRSYDVVLGEGARKQLADVIQDRVPQARVAAVVTSDSLRRMAWFDFESGVEQHVLVVPEGESCKSWGVLERLCEQLAELGLSRHDVIVAVGGGAVTDLAGFAASVYLRGVPIVQVPTTLVGQVDAAIGGKAAVNLRAGKNLVGAFHQPVGVLCDTATLSTLPERERLSGFGEIAKCWLLEGRRAKDLASMSLGDLVTLSVQLKAGIVMVDEFERGQRALLNYGHTLGHALELLALERGVDELRHGEAVAIGLAFAIRLAHALNRVGSLEVANHDQVLRQLGLSLHVPAYMSNGALLGAMGHDKKSHHDLAFVLAGPAGFEVVHHLAPELVTRELEKFRGEQ